MRTVTTVAALREALDAERRSGRSIGFVPTMGYLHDGHASLMRRAAAERDVVVTSIFVNPLQFGPTEDLAAYPRDLERDLGLAAAEGVAYVFAPPVDEMYPEPMRTSVRVAGVSEPLEGASRPGHFDGVSTVVAKLFGIVGACAAYFGEKDFQQLAIVRRMAGDLSFPVEVVGCPVIREDDGLAMSSRNVYLTPEERQVAPVLQRALRLGAAAIRSGTTDADEVRTLMRSEIQAAPLGKLDYVEVADPDTLAPLSVATVHARLFGAVRFGRARLIDNVGVADVPAMGPLPLLGP